MIVVGNHTREPDLRAALAAVEDGLVEATRSDVPFISEAARHLARPGGRRLRPLLVLLAAQFGDPGAPGVVPSAVVVELTHLATRYHDDVRHEANASVAVLIGDFLFARASRLLAGLGPRAVRLQADAFKRLVSGQILETTGPGDGHDPVAHHLRTLAARTGALTAVSGRLGALASGAGEEIADALAVYGERLGVARHLAAELRSPVQGAPTLPVLLSGDPSAPAVAEARQEVHRQCAAARKALTDLPEGPAREALAELCDTVTEDG
ncbi:polyprenyl synthetase family protein [Streptomyces sp. NPDC007983]|uniref:polyprenyl synthetase family protein n=1 Tax=Streptomyces sp. NPDC007983 TaxID=3364800 RepID=UPI0036E704D7